MIGKDNNIIYIDLETAEKINFLKKKVSLEKKLVRKQLC